MSDVDLSPPVVARVRDAADALEVVGDHVRLRRQGRRFVGLCPFHEEKTPSFSVDPERGVYYCFGCHAGGDLIDFVMRLERLDFPTAVERLARRFGVQLPPASPEARRRRETGERLQRVLEEAQRFFTARLTAPEGSSARHELERRGFAAAIWSEFGFGYAPDAWAELLGELGRRHPEQVLVDAGLAVPSERSGRPYDRFRGRITFPIRAHDGRLVAFGGRALGDGEPKYLNSPEGPLFQKRSTLFMLDRARQAMAEGGTAVVVEGYFDCLSLHRAGVRQAVATLGTSLTTEHARVLRRLTSRVVLCYDADAAGRRAAAAGARVLLEAGVEAAVLVLPAGQDPDDVVRESGGETFTKLLESPLPLLDFLLAEVPAAPDERRRAAAELAGLVGAARDPVTRFTLLEALARRVDLPLEVVLELAGARPTPAPEADAAGRRPLPPGEQQLAHALLEGTPVQRQRILDQALPEALQDVRVRRLFAAAAELLAQAPDTGDLGQTLVRTGADTAVVQLVAELSALNLPPVDESGLDRQLSLVVRRVALGRSRELGARITEVDGRLQAARAALAIAQGEECGRLEADVAALENEQTALVAEKIKVRRKKADQ